MLLQTQRTGLKGILLCERSPLDEKDNNEIKISDANKGVVTSAQVFAELSEVPRIACGVVTSAQDLMWSCHKCPGFDAGLSQVPRI